MYVVYSHALAYNLIRHVSKDTRVRTSTRRQYIAAISQECVYCRLWRLNIGRRDLSRGPRSMMQGDEIE